MRRVLLVAVALLATACGQAQQTASAPSTVDSPAPSSSAAPSTSTSTPAPTTTTPDPQPAPPPPAVGVPGTPCDITEGACVQLSTQQSWLISGGRVSYGPVPITSGRPGHRTPVGYFPVLRKVKDEVSREFDNAPMPYSTYFTNTGIAFHEGSLSEPSHGCIHLSRGAAATYFQALSIGDRVQVVA